MGSIYFRKDSKKWCVRFQHRGLPPLHMSFETHKEAKKWYSKTNKLIKAKIREKKIKKRLEVLNEEK